ncbi:hypothetical protein [Amphibiibacter pelophylacis]|uniref:Uncharacterized protein n=1 Tax=Amphibiibacter pelophylacis TaxID=1799477 RepID=A0ACC6NZM2_9BURK
MLAIMSVILARDFCLAVSMSDFVTWLSDDDHNFVENARFKAALNALGLTVDLRALQVTYFERTPVGTGDVDVYQPSKNSKNVFALNLYRDLTDQMDIVSFGIGCDEHCLSVVRENLRAFFDTASCQIHYEQASYSYDFRSMIDTQRYPVLIEDSGYQQLVHYTYG